MRRTKPDACILRKMEPDLFSMRRTMIDMCITRRMEPDWCIMRKAKLDEAIMKRRTSTDVRIMERMNLKTSLLLGGQHQTSFHPCRMLFLLDGYISVRTQLK